MPTSLVPLNCPFCRRTFRFPSLWELWGKCEAYRSSCYCGVWFFLCRRFEHNKIISRVRRLEHEDATAFVLEGVDMRSDEYGLDDRWDAVFFFPGPRWRDRWELLRLRDLARFPFALVFPSLRSNAA